MLMSHYYHLITFLFFKKTEFTKLFNLPRTVHRFSYLTIETKTLSYHTNPKCDI